MSCRNEYLGGYANNDDSNHTPDGSEDKAKYITFEVDTDGEHS